MSINSKKLIFILCICLSAIFLIHIGSSIGNRIKLDLTDENLYTLSKGTKEILKKLNTPVKLKFYYSKTAANKGSEGVRDFNNYSHYVKDLLQEFVANSRNNLTLEVIDPRPDTPDEEAALAFGLKKFHITDTESYFFGLTVINESGTEKVIEFFDPNKQENLEYEVIKLIYSVTHTQKKKLGILSSLSVLNEDMSPYMAQMMRMQGKTPEESWIFTKLLKEFYELKKINIDTDKISDVDLLMIIHPKPLSDKTLFAIDQFVLKGGKLLLLVDPHSIVDRPNQPMMGMQQQKPNTGSNLKILMDQWGVELISGEFAGDKYLSGVGRTSPNLPSARLLPLMNCDKRCSEKYKDAITAGLNKLTLVFPGALKKKELPKDSKFEVHPLLSTTEKGNTYRAEGYMLSNPQMLIKQFKEGSSPVIMGYKVYGSFKSAFPNGIEIEEGEKKKKVKKTGVTESQKESAIIVFSDVDFIHDQFAFQKSIFGTSIANQNINLVQNSLEILTGSKDLLSVRAKGKFNRSFDIIDKIEIEAQKGTEAKVQEINGSLQKFQAELNQLGKKANRENLALIQTAGIQKKKELSKKIAVLKRELRTVKRKGREKVENIGRLFQYLNTLLIPILLILFGLIYHKRHKNLRGA